MTEYPQDDGGKYTTLMVDGAEAVAAAVAAGGMVLIEPDVAEEAGTIATLEDPQGGVFSVLEV